VAKLLLDTCVWGGALEPLEQTGHEVEWAGSWHPDPGDSQILSYAHEHAQILVTLDKDFGELAIVKGQPHSGIIRLMGFRVAEMALAIDQILSSHSEKLVDGAIIVATPSKTRIRGAS